MNYLEWDKTPEGNLVATVRSENERDLSAHVEDPVAEINTIAVLSGLDVTVGGIPIGNLVMATKDEDMSA